METLVINGKTLYIYNGFTWHKNLNKGPNHYRCTKKVKKNRCPARLIMQNVHFGIERGMHLHLKPDDPTGHLTFKQKLKQRAREEYSTPQTLFNAVSREHPDIAVHIRPGTGVKTIQRERRKIRPKIPKTFELLGGMFDAYEPIESIYLGEVTDIESSKAYVFADRRMMPRLAEAREIFVDGTFKSVPMQPRGHQLLCFHITKSDMGFASVFALCERQTKEMYIAIWRFLVDRLPNLRRNLQTIICDFELGQIFAAMIIFPGIRIRGCWFHFCQAVTRQWKKKTGIDLDDEENADVTVIVRLTWALALLPANKIHLGINVIAEQAERFTGDHPRVAQFIRYLQRYWGRLTNFLSVYGTTIRTNNIAESFNSQLVGRIGAIHPDIFMFLNNLQKIMDDINLNWIRIDENHMILNGAQSSRHVAENAHIMQQQREIMNAGADDRVAMLRFLTAAMIARDYTRIMTLVRVVDNNDDEEDNFIVELVGFARDGE